MEFLQDVVADKKEVFKRGEYRPVTIPFWHEFAVNKLWDDVHTHLPQMIPYMPKEWKKAGDADREYFWNILNTFAPAFVAAYVSDARNQRLALKNKPKVKERKSLCCSAKWAKRIAEANYVSSKLRFF